ncbi:hypothetical protein [uncultured Fibrobacter sp.]|uniref:hypothetical protein n=1 Tax=uncultured Fibrobacter sp. TaxID=261512 RepID=UPI0025D49EE9|nr:hypothetical protein [uncultured Fibrobacter sp.]
MKFFCQKKFLFAVAFAIFFVACNTLEAPEPDDDFLPDSSLQFSLIPNDNVPGDSVDANLAHGVRIPVHPNGRYELSFDVDESVSKTPQLRLFRVYWNDRVKSYAASWVRTIKPSVSNGRYVYSFVCEESDRAVWITSLNDGKDFYEGRTRNVRLKGTGAYSDHFSVNLIVAGKIKDLGVSFDSLAVMLRKKFEEFYTSVKIDTVYVRYANKHPNVGKRYPNSEPWIAGRTSEDLMLTELGGWPEQDVFEALDIVLVHRFKQDGLLGLSDMFGANLGGGDGSTVVVANHNRLNGVDHVIDANRVVLTALHETGHFFGLRHTTATVSDQDANGDYSIFDDGFTDTPYCFQKSKGRAMATGFKAAADFRLPLRQLAPRFDFTGTLRSDLDISDCPDASNFMFPLESDVPIVGFSAQQLDVIKKNLMIMPH